MHPQYQNSYIFNNNNQYDEDQVYDYMKRKGKQRQIEQFKLLGMPTTTLPINIGEGLPTMSGPSF